MRYRHRALALIAAGALGAGTTAAVFAATDDGSAATATTTVVTQSATPAADTTTAAKSVSQIYADNVDGIAEIKVRQKTTTGQSGFSPFGPQQQTQTAQGTGFEIDSKGDIVTNAHVVSGASSITVTTHSGKSYSATLVGSDQTTDVAVIHINASSGDLHPLSFGDSTKLAVGDGVVAIGDPYGLTDSLTGGVVSALGRTITSPNNHSIENAIQTDAAINHGNSGGPLFNDQGQVIGITSQIYSDSSTSGNVGIGFAVPSATVQKIVSELITSGKASHPYLGVYLGDASGGAQIRQVTSGSPAAKAGLSRRELITQINGHTVTGASSAIDIISALHPGDTVQLTLKKGSAVSHVSVTLGSIS